MSPSCKMAHLRITVLKSESSKYPKKTKQTNKFNKSEDKMNNKNIPAHHLSILLILQHQEARMKQMND